MDKQYHIGKLRERVGRDAISAGIYMHQTMGFPAEIYMDTFDSMNLYEQASFLAGFRKRYPAAFNNT